MQNYFQKLKNHVSGLPDKKRYLELVTALLSVPVLATAVILNFNNLKPKSDTPTPTPTTSERVVYISPAEINEVEPTEECTKGIAPLEISSPYEGETITDNPVSININYKPGKFCAAVWSYRLDNGRWSDYSDRSIALYNLAKGEVKFDLRVKSIVTGEEKTLTRTFTYDGQSDVNLEEPTPSSSSAQ